MAMVVIVGWQVYDLARTDYGMTPKVASFQLGLLGLAQFVPFLLLTPVAGWAADRFERRTVARLANSIDIVVTLGLGWLTWQEQLSLPLLFSLAALHGMARVFVGPSMSAIAPNIVPPAALPRAIAMNSIAWQSGSVLGPAIGGIVYATSPSAPYWLIVLLLLVANVAMSFIPPVHPPQQATASHPLRQMVEGLTYCWKERFLLGTITLDLFAVLLAGATALLPVYARDILHAGPDGLGLLRAAPGVGAAIVALWLSIRPIQRNVGVIMLGSVVAFGVWTIAFGLSRNFTLSMSALALLGATDMLSVFIRSSLIQLNTPDSMRGRVGAVSGLAISASNELGELQSGTAAALMGPVAAVVFGGAGAILITAIWSRLFPELKNARTFAPIYREEKS